MSEAEAAAERGRRAFDRAVARERGAIAVHEHAAVFHDDDAERLELAAARELDGLRSENLRRRAVAERRLALVARERAQAVRARLTAEGVAVDGPPPDSP
jgi:hypothetical protein